MERIVVDPNIHFGQPCIQGTRIPVTCVLELVREDLSFEEIVRDHYPDIAKADIQACLEYASQLVREEEVHPSRA